MTTRGLIAGSVLALAAIGFGWSLFSALERWLAEPPAVESGDPDTATPAPGTPGGDAVARIPARLFFATEDGLRLAGVETEVPLAATPVDQARAIVEAQLAAQPAPPLLRTIPEGVTLRGVYVSERQELFIDLDATIRTAHPGGSMHEIHTVYTLVNAVLVNLPTLSGVQILIDGREVDTLAGHVDLRRPLARNDALLRDP